MSPRRLPSADKLSRNMDVSVAATWTPRPKPRQSTTATEFAQSITEPKELAPRGHVMRTPRLSIYAMPDEELPPSPSPRTQAPSYSRRSLIELTSLTGALSADVPSKYNATRRRTSASEPAKGIVAKGRDKNTGKKVHWADQSDESEPEKQAAAPKSRRRSSIVFQPSAFSSNPSASASASAVQRRVNINGSPGKYDRINLRRRSSGVVFRASEPASYPVFQQDVSMTSASPPLEDEGAAPTVSGLSTSTHPMRTRSSVRRESILRHPCNKCDGSEGLEGPALSSFGGGKPWTPEGNSSYPDSVTCGGFGAELLHGSPTPSPVESVLTFPGDPGKVDVSYGGALSEIESAELNFLRSNFFNPQDIRPVSDLPQVFATMTSVFGEPGTGLLPTQFVPASPKKPMFETDETRSSHRTPETSFLSEGSKKPSATKEVKKTLAGRYGETVYGANPALKSRHLDIELLRTRIPHRTLLSFNLNLDARRDAVAIGDRNSATTRPVDTIPMRRCQAGRDLQSRTREYIGSGMFNSRSGNRRRNSDPKAWIVGANGQRKRRRESDHYQEAKERDREMRTRRKINRAVDEGNLGCLQDIVSKEKSGISMERYTPADWSNLVTWRFIKLSAVVEIDGEKLLGRLGWAKKEETHVSWWAVPEKAITGMF